MSEFRNGLRGTLPAPATLYVYVYVYVDKEKMSSIPQLFQNITRVCQTDEQTPYNIALSNVAR